MNKYFLPLLLVSKCLFSQVEDIDSNLPAIPHTTQEAFAAFVTDLRAADVQWKNEEREEALRSYTNLLENSTNPLFTIALNFRKGILESQMGREEDAASSLRLALEPILALGDLNFDEQLSDEKTIGDLSVTTLIKSMPCMRSLCPR